MKTSNFFFALLLSTLLFSSCSSKLSKEDYENIDKNGIETVGTVTNKNYVTKTINNYKTTEYLIEFEFQHNDNTIIAKFSLGKDEDKWNKVQKGDKYKVKYIDSGDETDEMVILYIDEPVK